MAGFDPDFDWASPTNTAVGGAGSLAAIVEMTAGVARLGSNLKPYWNGWHGNQYVTTMEFSEIAHVAGRYLTFASAALDTYSFLTGKMRPEHYGLDLFMDGVGLWGGPVGAVAAIAYYAGTTYLDYAYKDEGGTDGLMKKAESGVGNLAQQWKRDLSESSPEALPPSYRNPGQ